MKLDVSLRPAADLAPYARNARKHSAASVARLASIIGDMGWTNPILVDADGVVAGHKRRLAAMLIYDNGGTIRLPNGKALPAGMVPVLDVTGWSDAQRRAYILADNQTTLESEWDSDVLKLELDWLDQSGEIDMGLTGFDGERLTAILKGWDSDIETVNKSGSHVDGIVRPIKITVAQDQRDAATEVITKALTGAGIEFTL